MIRLRRPDGKLIETWEDWARPKREYQWKAGRSAMELAKAWFRDGQGSAPSEITALLSAEPRLRHVQLCEGIPELVTALPERGEGRNHDLALVGKCASESVTICIEAKADEPFGNHTVEGYWNLSMKRRNSGLSTRAPERIQALLGMVGQSELSPSVSSWGAVRYQLLTAICGTLRQAEKDVSSLAVFIVHEFHNDSTCKKNLTRNHGDFEKLLSVFTSAHGVANVEPGRLYGPFKTNGPDLFIGKAVAEPCGGL